MPRTLVNWLTLVKLRKKVRSFSTLIFYWFFYYQQMFFFSYPQIQIAKTSISVNPLFSKCNKWHPHLRWSVTWSQTSLNCRKLEEETTIELFTNWLFRDNSSYVEQWIYDNRFEVMIQCDALNFFTLDGKKISLKKSSNARTSKELWKRKYTKKSEILLIMIRKRDNSNNGKSPSSLLILSCIAIQF